MWRAYSYARVDVDVCVVLDVHVDATVGVGWVDGDANRYGEVHFCRRQCCASR